MGAFKFRLASVLRVREHVKDEKQWELRVLYESRRGVVTEIDALEKQLLDSGTYGTEGEVFSALELRVRAEHEQSIAKRIKSKRTTLSLLDNTIVEKRAELLEAMRGLKALEQLRRRQEERYWRAENTTEQRFTDEIAQRKFVQPQSRKKIPS
jgi:flagellar export protein FliJ